MHPSVLLETINRPYRCFLSRTTVPFRVVISLALVAFFVLSPQMWSMNDGNGGFDTPIVAIVARINLLSSPIKGREQLDQLNKQRTAIVWVDNAVHGVPLNLAVQDSRSRLHSFCLLLC